MFYYLKSPPELQQEKKIYLLYAVLLGGIIGNLIDRLVYGYVIDFLHFSFWPAFNIADTSISLSIIGLIYYYWKEK
ncbi:signal peptidase II [Candidatus Woesearchaeota archaeon]|nr:signal peptidase II [Candidatus Woesearchaeota archaeon]